jgi:diguanylate cyclase (GGDEF)-like protein
MTTAVARREPQTGPRPGVGAGAVGMQMGRAPSKAGRSLWTAVNNLSLSLKVALTPGLTLLLMGLMLIVSVRMGEQNTRALRMLDRDVFEPLNRAEMLKDEITALHTRLFALLLVGNNEINPTVQRIAAADLIELLDTEAAKFDSFLAAIGPVLPPVTLRLGKEFKAYAARMRETVGFAAYDASYGALLAPVTNDQFSLLHADLEVLVQALSLRRAVLTEQTVSDSLAARRLLRALGFGVVVLALLGSFVVGRWIARPILRLTLLMSKLAHGDTDLTVPGTKQRDEVGAMARAVEVFRANVIARRQGETTLVRTNLQFDAALNSMLHGMLVWSPDHLLQLVNNRFLTICELPPDCLTPGMTVRQAVDSSARHGLRPGEDPEHIISGIVGRLTAGRSAQIEITMRPGLRVRISYEPMINGGNVVTFEDVTKKRESEERIAFMARHDALTGLPNRNLFHEHLETAVAQLGEGHQFAVLSLDLDHFKEVNDTFGHAAGDELLRLVAARLRLCVRDQDLIARLGGDEFAIVLASMVEGPPPAAAIAHRLVESIAAPYDVQGHNVVIGASVGIALLEPDASCADFMKRADVALYRAKKERGTFAFYEPGMDEHLHARRELEADLRLALQRGEFELYYQPAYNFTAGRVTCFEALARWNSPTRGRVAPADFIQLADQTGLIVPIGKWVLRTACTEAASWPDHVSVAVNLSPVQFKHKQLSTIVRETLKETGLPTRRLELEITETVLLQDTEAVVTTLRSLHELGVRVSLDDFGTGYTSLNYLLCFPFDKIKIDRSFVGEVQEPPGDGATTTSKTIPTSSHNAAIIVHTIVGLANNLGIATIAEGVETQEQFARIQQMGCTEVQGYFLSQPMPANEIEGLRQHLDATMPIISKGQGALPRRVA